jgi:hypothetical protein
MTATTVPASRAKPASSARATIASVVSLAANSRVRPVPRASGTRIVPPEYSIPTSRADVTSRKTPEPVSKSVSRMSSSV